MACFLEHGLGGKGLGGVRAGQTENVERLNSITKFTKRKKRNALVIETIINVA